MQIKRTLPALLAIVALPLLAGSGRDTAVPEGKRLLSLEHAEAVVRSHRSAFEACYIDHGVRGTHPIALLRVGIIVRRDGSARTAEVSRKYRPVSKVVKQCATSVVARMKFPRSRAVTKVVVPFMFLQVGRSVRAGPFPSCWRTRGCQPRAIGRALVGRGCHRSRAGTRSSWWRSVVRNETARR